MGYIGTNRIICAAGAALSIGMTAHLSRHANAAEERYLPDHAKKRSGKTGVRKAKRAKQHRRKKH